MFMWKIAHELDEILDHTILRPIVISGRAVRRSLPTSSPRGLASGRAVVSEVTFLGIKLWIARQVSCRVAREESCIGAICLLVPCKRDAIVETTKCTAVEMQMYINVSSANGAARASETSRLLAGCRPLAF